MYTKKAYVNQIVNNVIRLAYILTDVIETIITENFYQPIPVSILKYYTPKGAS